MTSRRDWLRIPWERLGVLATFAGATTYIALRLTTATHRHAPLGVLWDGSVLLYWLEALVVVGVVSVPAVRALKVEAVRRKIDQGLAAAALLVAALGLPVLLAAWPGHFSWVEVLAADGPKHLPSGLTWSALGVAVLGVPALKLNPLPGSRLVVSFLEKRLPLSVLLGAVGGVVAGWSSWDLASSMGSFAWWQLAVAASAWASVLGFSAYLVFGSRR